MYSGRMNLKPLLIVVAIIGAMFIGVIWIAANLAKSNEIKLEKPLVPEMVIEVKDGIADTTYVYIIK